MRAHSTRMALANPKNVEDSCHDEIPRQLSVSCDQSYSHPFHLCHRLPLWLRYISKYLLFILTHGCTYFLPTPPLANIPRQVGIDT